MSKIEQELNKLIQSYLKEYPKRKLKIDVKSESVLNLWSEFNYKGFLHQVESGPLAKIKDEIVDSNNKVVSLKQSLKKMDLTKINFHFGDDKKDTVIVTEALLLKVIKSILIEGLPEKKTIRKKSNDSIAGFINKSFLTIQQLKQHGFNNDFIAFFLNIDVETFKKTLRDIKKRRGQMTKDLS